MYVYCSVPFSPSLQTTIAVRNTICIWGTCKITKLGMGNAGIIRDQRYRTGPDTGMPMMPD
jgi:hypothetical protein